MSVKSPKAITISGLVPLDGSLKTPGLGFRPLIESIARIRNTAAALPGMPSDRTGIRLAPDTAELAASVAATPCGTPVPNFVSSSSG